ncbi:hypothetical protein EYS09_24805 [Streptomyces kasugaensis]|uniref:Uncharacterized protein n=1 Tax=Streptomyces kasugaensis TaxID=1946 RepID=A0A4Q9HQ41_STRKA|nr:hypothetical protein [Streptomyces kasugaensis]TBO57026.1 hypothetical protein EYS09_24805 [Streptomyces kasugaensis]
MLRLITSRRLADLTAERTRLHDEHTRLVEELDAARLTADKAVQDEGAAWSALDDEKIRADIALHQRDDARADAARLRAEVDKLTAEAQGPTTVYALLYYGTLYSVHHTEEDAQIHAALQGAPRDGWVPAGDRPDTEVHWRVRRCSLPAPLGGEDG